MDKEEKMEHLSVLTSWDCRRVTLMCWSREREERLEGTLCVGRLLDVLGRKRTLCCVLEIPINPLISTFYCLPVLMTRFVDSALLATRERQSERVIKQAVLHERATTK